MFGRGSGDMKCGFAMGVLALRALQATGADTDLGPLTFVAAIEEECTGNGTLATIEAGVLADAVVLLEPTDLSLLVGGAGILWVEITVEGRAAHAEAAAGAVSAIDAALPLLGSLRQLEDKLNLVGDPRIATERPLRVNVGRIRGGDWTSSVPSVARLDVRVGYPYTWTPQDAEREVRDHIAAAAATDAWLAVHPPSVRPVGFRAHGYDLPVDHPLAESLARAHRAVLREEPARFAMATTTDARSYLLQGGVPAICYGPRTVRIHGIDEAVELASIVEGARVLARFIAAWSATPSEP
jgi:acetylornithine deacetylase